MDVQRTLRLDDISDTRYIMACQVSDVKFFWCTQVAALCGVHCLNTLLQGAYFSEWDLAEIAHQLDALEKQFMAEGGMHTDDFRKFMAEESGNVSGDGMFSSQV